MCRDLLWKCSHRFKISVVSIEVAVDAESFGSVGLLCGYVGLFYGNVGLFYGIVDMQCSFTELSLGHVGVFSAHTRGVDRSGK